MRIYFTKLKTPSLNQNACVYSKYVQNYTKYAHINVFLNGTP